VQPAERSTGGIPGAVERRVVINSNLYFEPIFGKRLNLTAGKKPNDYCAREAGSPRGASLCAQCTGIDAGRIDS
jgi:hypothetical protein